MNARSKAARAALCATLLMAAGCSGKKTTDGGTPDASNAGTSDAGARDASATDASATDASATDAGTSDASAADASTSTTDAGTSDAGAPDSGSADASTAMSDAGPAPLPDAAMCMLLGDYVATIPPGPGPSMQYYFRFSPDGTWVDALTQTGLSTSPIGGGTYTVSGTTVMVTGPTTLGCTSSQVGTYTMSFDVSCAITLTVVGTDPCSARQSSINGATLSHAP